VSCSSKSRKKLFLGFGEGKPDGLCESLALVLTDASLV
jgi:hypothetical protein